MKYMVHIYFIALLLSHIIIIKTLKNKILNKKFSQVFKMKVIMAPISILLSLLIIKVIELPLDELKYGNQSDIWTFIYVWVLVGPVEEILYRGFVQGTLSNLVEGNIFYISYATIIASLIFVLAHITNVYSNNESWESFLGMIPTRFIAALVLGFSFQISKSLIYPIIIHNLIDGFNLSVLTYRKQQLKNEDEKIPKEEL